MARKPNPKPTTTTPPPPTLGHLGRAEASVREAKRALGAAQAGIAESAASATLTDWKVSPADATSAAMMVGLRTDASARASARIEALRVALASPASLADPEHRSQIEARLTRAIDAAPRKAVQDCSAMVLGAAIAHWVPPSD